MLNPGALKFLLVIKVWGTGAASWYRFKKVALANCLPELSTAGLLCASCAFPNIQEQMLRHCVSQIPGYGQVILVREGTGRKEAGDTTALESS